MSNKNNEKLLKVSMWNGESIMFNVHEGYEIIGKVEVKKGDLFYLDYGRSMGVYTISGKGYESEYKYGKIISHSMPITKVLTQEEVKNLITIEINEKDFNKKNSERKKEIEPIYQEMLNLYKESVKKRNEEKIKYNKIVEDNSEKKIKETIEKMGYFFDNSLKNKIK